MPELPEVETVRRSISAICGKTIDSVWFSKLAPIETCSRAALLKALQASKLREPQRLGKYLIFTSNQEKQLVLHLGMSGKVLFHQQEPAAQPKHLHMKLTFNDGSVLLFEDARRFGTLSLVEAGKPNSNAFLNRIGPDWLAENFSVNDFISRTRKHPKLNMKALTMDQRIATGLGNIYACEALFTAKISPERLVKDCSDKELTALYHASQRILRIGIEKAGSSIRDYINGQGSKGEMQEFLQVYGRKGKTLDGKFAVSCITQQGRSTWWCPEMQR